MEEHSHLPKGNTVSEETDFGQWEAGQTAAVVLVKASLSQTYTHRVVINASMCVFVCVSTSSQKGNHLTVDNCLLPTLQHRGP